MSHTLQRTRAGADRPSAAGRPSPIRTFGVTSLAWIVGLGVAAGLLWRGAGVLVATLAVGAMVALLGLRARRLLARPDTEPPWWLHWDVLGTTAALALAGLATVAGVEALRGGPGLYRTTQVALPVVIAGGLFAAGAAVALARREGLGLRRLPRTLVRVWTDPPADWAFFVLGVLIALPLAALYSSVLRDTDSTRVIVATARARHEGLGFLTQTQQVFLPILVFTPVTAVAGIAGATAVSIATMQALAGVVAFVTRKLTASAVAPVAAVLALLSIQPLLRQAGMLPMYPLMLALGSLAAWVGLRALRAEGRSRLGLAVLTGFLLAATAETHDIGKLFVAVPLFLLALEPTWRGVKGAALTYGALAVFAIPRIMVNLAEGGFDRFLTNRSDWMTGAGYTRLINREFWQHPVVDKGEFFGTMLGQYLDGFGWLVLLSLGLALLAFATARWRTRLFALACGGLLLYGLLRTNAPPHARYLSPLLPGAAVGAGVGLWLVWRRWRNRLVAGVLLVGLLLGASISYARTVDGRQKREEAVVGQRLERIVERIDDERAVMGVRTVRLMSVSTHLRLGNWRFEEQDLVTYLTWPSDREVLDLLRRHDVGWLLVLRSRGLETEYHNTWVEPVYGKQVRHAEMLARSPSFCRVVTLPDYYLYRVGSCPQPQA